MTRPKVLIQVVEVNEIIHQAKSGIHYEKVLDDLGFTNALNSSGSLRLSFKTTLYPRLKVEVHSKWTHHVCSHEFFT